MRPILIADDNVYDIEAMSCLLQKNRVLNPIAAVGSGEEAISYLAGEGKYADRTTYPYPVLLLLDLKMRGVSGTDVLRWIKDHGHLIATVVLTGLDPEEIKRGYKLGAQSFVSKPVQQQDFANMINGLRGVSVKFQDNGVVLAPLA